MGGIFKAPKAPPMPAPQLFADPVTDPAQSRVAQIQRRRRGRAGTVQTSDRGLIALNAKTPQKKSLLGE